MNWARTFLLSNVERKRDWNSRQLPRNSTDTTNFSRKPRLGGNFHKIIGLRRFYVDLAYCENYSNPLVSSARRGLKTFNSFRISSKFSGYRRLIVTRKKLSSSLQNHRNSIYRERFNSFDGSFGFSVTSSIFHYTRAPPPTSLVSRIILILLSFAARRETR